jgi:phosphohistidine phosphatase SixA
MARRIAVMGVAPSLILASPYARAAETAGIAADVLSYDGEILPAPCLVPDSRPADVWNEIRSHPQASSLLLVGHEPLLSTTLAWMLGVANAAQFPTAGLARVDAEPSPVARASMRFRIAPSDA